MKELNLMPFKLTSKYYNLEVFDDSLTSIGKAILKYENREDFQLFFLDDWCGYKEIPFVVWNSTSQTTQNIRVESGENSKILVKSSKQKFVSFPNLWFFEFGCMGKDALNLVCYEGLVEKYKCFQLFEEAFTYAKEYLASNPLVNRVIFRKGTTQFYYDTENKDLQTF